MPLRALAGKAVKQDKTFVVPVELRGKRQDGREVLHSRAEIVLAPSLPKPPPADAAPAVTAVAYDVPTRVPRVPVPRPGPARHRARSPGRATRAFVGTAYPAPAPADWFESRSAPGGWPTRWCSTPRSR